MQPVRRAAAVLLAATGSAVLPGSIHGQAAPLAPERGWSPGRAAPAGAAAVAPAAGPGAGGVEGPGRPRIGLVLGGGGARGLAHVGVLRVLEELRVPVDLVVGTSMGSIVGALYAAGVSPAEMEAWLAGADFGDLFRDIPPYRELSFRRKQEARGYPVRLELGFGPGGIRLPPGLIAGQKLNAELRHLLLPAAGVVDFDSLAIPFRAVATDLETGEMAVLATGDLVDAVRASMSVPGVFTPYPLGDRLLVDGGLTRNLAVDVARSMGADAIIAVDVGTPLMPRTELESVVAVTLQVSTMMTQSGTGPQRRAAKDLGVLLEPRLDMSATDFGRAPEAVEAGAAAARADPDLRRLALPAPAFEEHRDRLRSFRREPRAIRSVVVGGMTRRAAAATLERIHTRPGGFDEAVLARDVERLFGLGIYDLVDYRIVPTSEGDVALLTVHEKPYGPNFLRFRLSIRDDFGGNGSYNFATHILVPQINRWGGELVAETDLGDVNGLRLEFYQPVGIRGAFFLSPDVRYRVVSADSYDGVRATARYRIRSAAGGLALGVTAGAFGDLRMGIERGWLDARPQIGPDTLPEYRIGRGRVYARLNVDVLDDPEIPRRGIGLEAEYGRELSALGSEDPHERLMVNLLLAGTRDRNTVHIGFLAATSGDGGLPPYEKFGLGGFLLLSGFRPGHISGDHMALGRFMFIRQITEGGLYAGASFELGDAWHDDDPRGAERLRTSGSIAVGMKTFFGPIYLAYGLGGPGDGIPYVVVGRTL